MERPILSFVIITKNAEKTISSVLNSLPRSHREIVVLDSGSTDSTLAICREFGVNLHSRFFDDFSSQKNAACELATGRWIFVIDADEVLSPDLSAELMNIASHPNPQIQLYSVRRQLVFMGRKMRFGRSVDYPRRFFLNGSAKFQNPIHEVLVPSDAQQSPDTHQVGRLIHPLYHHSYVDLADYFDKFNRYTSLMAADKWNRGLSSPRYPSLLLRPWVNFFYRYVICFGFLDGYPGYLWSLLGAFYSFVKYAKLRELTESHQRETSK